MTSGKIKRWYHWMQECQEFAAKYIARTVQYGGIQCGAAENQGHSGSREGGHNILPAGWCTSTYSKSFWTSCIMRFVATRCSINIQSTLSVGGPGHHVHKT